MIRIPINLKMVMIFVFWTGLLVGVAKLALWLNTLTHWGAVALVVVVGLFIGIFHVGIGKGMSNGG